MNHPLGSPARERVNSVRHTFLGGGNTAARARLHACRTGAMQKFPIGRHKPCGAAGEDRGGLFVRARDAVAPDFRGFLGWIPRDDPRVQTLVSSVAIAPGAYVSPGLS